MNIQKFTYRATELIEPLTECIRYLDKRCESLIDESNKFKQQVQDDPYNFNNDLHMNLAKANEVKVRSLRLQIKRFKIWLDECKKQSWFNKYKLDENDLSEIYQYKFTDLNLL